MWPWIGFLIFIVLMLALDLGLFNRRPHVIRMSEALAWFGVWIGLALLFNIGLVLFHERGLEAGLEFFTGYLVEKSLSIDNVFVFILIFNYFQVPPVYQHKVLSLGIVGAIVLRLIFIVGGLALLNRFHWTIYLFGTFLLATGLMMMLRKETEYEPDKNWAVRTLRRFIPVTENFEKDRFFIRINGQFWATPLLIALLAIESSDILFAADSIPAIFAVTHFASFNCVHPLELHHRFGTPASQGGFDATVRTNGTTRSHPISAIAVDRKYHRPRRTKSKWFNAMQEWRTRDSS